METAERSPASQVPVSTEQPSAPLADPHTRLAAQPRPWVMLILALILAVAAILRFTGMNWDANKHLHPDERFLTTVVNDIRWPENFDSYFDPQNSPLSPYSLPTMGLYVYGTLPPWIVKAVVVALNQSNYDAIAIFGRLISGLFDIGSIFLLFYLGRRLYGNAIALLAAALLAFSVLNIQQSHFFTVDTFANLFVVLVMLLAVRIVQAPAPFGRWADYAGIGLALGAGMASKLSVATLAVPILLAAGWDFVRRMRHEPESGRAVAGAILGRVLLMGVLTILTFRLLQPIAFQGPEFWNFSLNPTWLDDIQEQQKILAGEIDAPPWHQWTNRPALIFPLQNMLLWGMGLPLGIAAWLGFALAVYELVRQRKFEHLLPLVYVGVTFGYHGTLWVKFMRYFLPIYPFLALFAAYLLLFLYRRLRQIRLGGRMLPTGIAALPAILVVLGTACWALAFTSIYMRQNPRVAASFWIYDHAPAGTVIANEHWDDSLPLAVGGRDLYNDGTIRGVEMPNYDDDTPEKLDRMIDAMSQANFISLSSNRLIDSIPRLPMRFPMTIRYYELLLNNQLGYKKVAEFSSYPTLFGLQFPDQSSEESFTVYDHPRVLIFQKQPDFEPQTIRERLGAGIQWDQVARLTPKQATAAPDMLMLSISERDQYQAAAQSRILIPWAVLGRTAPLLIWALILFVIGLAATPVTLLALGGLPGHGYALARVLGLLMIGWLAWWLASTHLMMFGGPSVGLALVLLTISSWGLGFVRRAELGSIWQRGRRAILIQEGLFWLLFFAAVWVRWQNPDLWHPSMGGEKPMDTAYLTAIVQTPFFPSYDPWFAGGYINYYYFGFVLVAALVHLTGIAVPTAYNLAVPTLYAMTGAGAFCAAAGLAHTPSELQRRRWQAWLLAGLLAPLLVVMIGNLGQVQLLWDGVKNLGTVEPARPPEPPKPDSLGGSIVLQALQFRLAEASQPLRQVADGLNKVRTEGARPDFRQEWWYWNATRIYPPAKDEAGPITEFPLFTFLFADLHAHMMALPLTVLALTLGIAIVRLDSAGTWGRARVGAWLRLGIAALVLGALWPTNTWDFPSYAVLTAAAFAVAAYARSGRIDLDSAWAAGWRWLVVIVVGFLLFKPFHDYSASAYFGAEQWKGSRTPFWAYLFVHGLFVFVLMSDMLRELRHGRSLNPLARVVGLWLRKQPRQERLYALHRRLVRAGPWYDLCLALLPIVGLLLLALIVLGHTVEAFALLMAGLALLLLPRQKPEPSRQFMLVMVALGALLTAVVEVVVLKGDISRMNTVFKFYLQVWVLWSIASAVALAHMLQPAPMRPQQMRRPGGLWWLACGLLLFGSLLYPLTAIPGRIDDRFEQVDIKTLDGSAYMRTAIYRDRDQDVVLANDYDAMAWMRANIPGLPTIVEANTPLYHWGGRVSIYTGFPTVIGWDWHQKQQRAILPGQMIDKRLEDVRTIYSDPNPETAQRLLRNYAVEYIYLGQLERMYYGGDGLKKFEQFNGQLWDKVYDQGQVQIYRVR